MANKTGAWSYDELKKSQVTTDADKNRQSIAANKPGEFTHPEYADPENVKQAWAQVDNHKANNKPGAFSFAGQAGWDDIKNQILNGKKFTYDLNGDALYQQYKDMYMLQGQQAMMDTMGQAQAMTGGYGNSYAQQVGQQTYQGYLQQLNDKVPELYQLALDQYNQERQDLYNQYSLYADQYDREYGQHRDSLSDYWTALNYLTDDARYKSQDAYTKYTDQRDFKHALHRDSVTDWQYEMGRADDEYWNNIKLDYDKYFSDRDLSYKQHRDSVSDAQYAEKLAYQKEQDAIANEWKKKEFDEAIREFDVSQSNKGSSGGSGGSGGTNNAAFADTLWTATGTYDDNGNAIFRNSEGKTQAFGPGINPYTGTKNADAKNGTFGNGYQPNNIGGTKLTNSGMSTTITGKSQTIWKANGKYWLWRGDLNKYIEVDISDMD